MAKKGKAKAAAGSGLSAFCRLLADGITGLKKDIPQDRKAIAAQERFIQRLIKQGAKPAVVDRAKQRLTMLKNKLVEDEAQLNAFQEEFAADCR